jgi:hypothetical protein
VPPQLVFLEPELGAVRQYLATGRCANILRRQGNAPIWRSLARRVGRKELAILATANESDLVHHGTTNGIGAGRISTDSRPEAGM